MTTGIAAKQKQRQKFLLSLPFLAFHLKSHEKSWKRASGILKGTQMKNFQTALIKIRKSEA